MKVSNFVAFWSAGGWTKLPGNGASGLVAGLIIAIAYAMWTWQWVPLLSTATLLIHEAGHVIIGALMGERMMVYGGTIFQLLFPVVFCVYFARGGDALGFCFSVAWESTAIHAMGVYVADARTQGLPLVGNGERLHDWAKILGRWGLLTWDHALGRLCCGAAWLALFSCAVLLFDLWRANQAGKDALRPRRPF